MSGLIYKDLRVVRKSLRAYVLLLVFYLLLGLADFYDPCFVLIFLPVSLLIVPISVFSYDEHTKWERYAVCLPVTRRQLVTARYGFVLLLALYAAALGAAVCVMFSLMGRSTAETPLATMLASLGAGLFIVDVMLPLNYKLGPKGARSFLYAVVLLPIAGLFIANRLAQLSLSQPHQLAPTALVPLAALAGFGISWLISVHIMEQKEF